ncbi:hypothetical protein [Glycomyces salinus]|uniref:hypothetical protein n=1 Tax=Glycomyces salinus TaxID=980294 RepID=UPI0018EA734B|nr:hypothetical protein [Glycomyces salinus]
MTTAPVVQQAPPSKGRVFISIVWALLPALSLGIATPFAFMIAWIRRRTVGAFFSFIFYGGLVVWSISSNDGPREDLAMGAYLLIAWLFASAHTFVIRPRVWYYTPGPIEAEPVRVPAPEPEATAEDAPRAEEPFGKDFEPIVLAHREPAVAFAAWILVSAGDEGAVPRARFEQRFFGNGPVEPLALEHLAQAGSINLQHLSASDPDAADAVYTRAGVILAELGAGDLALRFSHFNGSTASEQDEDHAEATDAATEPIVEEPEPEPSATADATAEEAPREAASLGRQVCESNAYLARTLGLRRVPNPEDVAAIIDAAEGAGGVLSMSRVGALTGRTTAVDGYVSQLQRVLNIDGTPVLSRQDDGASIRLDTGLLRQQFLGGNR